MMITDREKFPKYDASYDEILRECNNYPNGIKRGDLIKNVYKNNYSDYSLDILLSEKKKTPLIYDRIAWWITYLFHWKFIENPSYWIYTISNKWQEFLKSWKRLDSDVLQSDKDFLTSDFRVKSLKPIKNTKNKVYNTTTTQTTLISTETPQEVFERAYKEIEGPKKADLLQRLREVESYQFEKIVWILCEAMWYWTFIETPKSHDWWVDGIIKWDSLWFEKIFIQAKRYAEWNIVNEKEMRDFIWALWSSKVRKAIFFTTSTFATKAKEAAENASIKWNDILLIEWNELVELMFKYNVWVQVREIYEIKYIDEDFFSWIN